MLGMSILPMDIASIVAGEKELLIRPKWDEDSDPRYFVMTVALMSEGPIIGGFELRAKASKAHIDRDAIMQLEFAKTGRERIELARCQWRPFETHRNKNWGPPGYEFKSFYRESHYHMFEHNYLPSERRMRSGSLPAAVPIVPDPRTLSEFIAFSGGCFRIKNIQILEVPNVSADMFWVKK